MQLQRGEDEQLDRCDEPWAQGSPDSVEGIVLALRPD